MSRKRIFETKKRNSHRLEERPVLLLVAEGKNVTEKTYFSQFISTESYYSIKIINAGNTTDPEGLFKVIEKAWSELKLETRKKDIAFVVLDLDCDELKALKLQNLVNQRKHIRFVISNPCFEIWYLLHFKYSTKPHIDSSSVISELRKHLNGYEKTSDVNDCLRCLEDKAVFNAEKLCKYHTDQGHAWPSNQSNPRTDVHELMNMLLKKRAV